ncbi:MAG: FliH/SctL family protein [Candidatus Neomarinimicrobiota bacterium]
MMEDTVIRLSKAVHGFWSPRKVQGEDIKPEDILDMKNREITQLNRKIKNLEGEIQKTREQSYTLGFDDGLNAEREKHREALEAHARQLQDLSANLETEVGQTLKLMEEPLLRMSFNIAEKILRGPLPAEYREKALTSTIIAFLHEVLHAGSVVVRVARENFEMFQKEDIGEQLDYPTPERLRFVIDENLQPGECQVETPEHLIEGNYSTQLANLAQELG